MVLRGAFALLLFLSATPAWAQFSGSATLLSDYRYRGASLSDGRPAVQLGVAYDREDGGYAGLLVSSARFAFDKQPDALLLPYVGYAHRLPSGLTWEVGAQYSRFAGAGCCHYAELYAGFGSDHLNGRLYYAHDYFGLAPSVYAELNGSHTLSERLRALGHFGVLRVHGARPGDTAARYRYDLRVGFGLTLRRTVDLQLTWGIAGGRDGRYTPYPLWDPADRSAWVLGLSRRW